MTAAARVRVAVGVGGASEARDGQRNIDTGVVCGGGGGGGSGGEGRSVVEVEGKAAGRRAGVGSGAVVGANGFGGIMVWGCAAQSSAGLSNTPHINKQV